MRLRTALWMMPRNMKIDHCLNRSEIEPKEDRGHINKEEEQALLKEVNPY